MARSHALDLEVDGLAPRGDGTLRLSRGRVGVYEEPEAQRDSSRVRSGQSSPDLERPLDGISILPILSQEISVRDRPIGFQSAKQIAWHENDFKIYSPNSGQSWEMYDLAKDPTEADNLAIREPARLSKMVSEAKRWIDSCSKSDHGMDY